MAIDIRNISKHKVEKSKPKEKETSFLNKDIQLFGSNSFGDKQKERFYADLNVLFSAGVDLGGALQLVVDETTKKNEKELFTTLRDKVIMGTSLSDAMKASDKFSGYEYYSVKIGEETGRLPEVLHQLNLFFTRKIAQKRKVTSALSYPVIVLFTAIGAVYFMLRFVVPMFEDMFQRFGGELPASTRFVLNASDWLGAYGGLLVLAVIGIVTLLYMNKAKKWFRVVFSTMLLNIPFVGNIVGKIYLARFCQAMRLLLASDTPLVRSIELVEKMIGFYPIESAMKSVNEDLYRGISLHQALEKHIIFPQRMVALIKVAEEVNQLDLIFEKIEEQYNGEVEHQSTMIGNTLEPILIIFIGIFVAIILLSMYLPLFSVSTEIH